MDFAFALDARPVALPRGYAWEGSRPGTTYTNEYGMIGSGRKLTTAFFFADAVNERGLCGACLYFPGYAEYTAAEEGSTALAPHEVVSYIIGRCADLDDVREQVSQISVTDTPVPLLGITPPLHWIFTDSSGRTVTVESSCGELVCKENPVGVMTNSPNIEWHITNLSNYLDLSPEQLPEKEFSAGYTAKPFGQGTGSLSLPGGYTPPQRFVRAAFLRSVLPPLADTTAAVRGLLHTMHSFDIPRGANIKSDGTEDYTQYTSVLCGRTASVVFVDHDSPIPFEARLDSWDDISEPVEFGLPEFAPGR